VGGVGEEEHPLLVRHPFDLEDAWIEVVVPSLTALLAQPSLDELGDEGPTLRSILFHQSADQVILLLSPRFLSQKARPVVLRLHIRIVVILLDGLLLVGFLDHFKST
jgi:hypothetical protein